MEFELFSKGRPFGVEELVLLAGHTSAYAGVARLPATLPEGVPVAEGIVPDDIAPRLQVKRVAKPKARPR